MTERVRITYAQVEIDPGVHIRIVAPRTAPGSGGLRLPWAVHLGSAVSISAEHRDVLVALRDALAAALAAQPVDEPEGGA